METETTQKAKIENNSGLVLFIPKEGNGSMLFLEWIAMFPGGKAPLITIINDRENNVLRIRMVAMLQTFLDAKDYINSNL